MEEQEEATTDREAPMPKSSPRSCPCAASSCRQAEKSERSSKIEQRNDWSFSSGPALAAYFSGVLVLFFSPSSFRNKLSTTDVEVR